MHLFWKKMTDAFIFILNIIKISSVLHLKSHEILARILKNVACLPPKKESRQPATMKTYLGRHD